MRPRVNFECLQEGCNNPAKARGYCASHYNAFRRKVLGAGNRVPVPRCDDGLPHAWANGWCRLCGTDKPKDLWTVQGDKL